MAVIIVNPVAMPVISPALSIVALDVSDETNWQREVTFCTDPSENSPMTETCCCVPTVTGFVRIVSVSKVIVLMVNESERVRLSLKALLKVVAMESSSTRERTSASDMVICFDISSTKVSVSLNDKKYCPGFAMLK